MPHGWSRRALLASVAAAVAGCSTGVRLRATPTTAGRSTDTRTRVGRSTPSPADGSPPTDASPPPPTEAASPSPAGDVERLPADEPALAWAVRLPDAVAFAPAADPDGRRVYVGAGEPDFGTPTAGDGAAESGALFGLRATDGSGAWRATTGNSGAEQPSSPPIAGSPVAHGGQVYVATGYSDGLTGVDQRIVAYGRDGTRRWATEPTRGFLSIVAAEEGRVFAGTSDDALGVEGQRLFAVESDGRVRWERAAGDAMGATVAGGRLLYSAGMGALVSYDPADGTEQWRIPGEPLGPPQGAIVAFDGHCFVESSTETADGYPLVAHSTADGTERWRYSSAPKGGENFVPTSVAGVPDSLADGNGDPSVVGAEFGGTVFALGDDGSERWWFAADGGRTYGPVIGDAVYVGDEAGTVYALDPSDGRERWRASLPGFATVHPLLNGVLAVSHGEDEHVLASFRADGGEHWRYRTGKELTSPAVAGERAYVGADDGTVLAFAATGDE